LYLVWPALYSTVTDSYRLSRRGRLGTDLGGVYFNTAFIAGMSLGYLATGSPWLLVAIVLLHIGTATQFMPVIRLDGYYILSDLIGVPDLFSRLGPVLTSMIPGRATHPRVLELKPWVRRTITLWVVIAVPVLLFKGATAIPSNTFKHSGSVEAVG
jgi:putative peptide zinc metalloprotease protein